MKLNVGCGPNPKDGYTNIDIVDYGNEFVRICDCRNIDFVDVGTVDEIYAKDVLEHFPYHESKEILKHWVSLLKTGGKIFIQTTNFDLFVECYNKKIWDIDHINYMLFAGIPWGKQSVDDTDFHKSIYTYEKLSEILNSFGVRIESTAFDRIDDLVFGKYNHNLNMYVWGVKE